MMDIELMSPAGNLESLIAAINGGADSVYLGLNKFNARRPAKNFTPYVFKKAISFAHDKGVKLYVTLNIDLKPNELYEACQMLEFLREVKVDGIIIKDPAIILLINKFFKDIPIHFSTQTALQNSLDVLFAIEHNAQRVVLARELDANEIALCAKMPVEIEIFTEGSMCFSVSGRCLMSSFVGGRSGNRGACTGCCRIAWTDSHGSKKSFFSMKDLCLASSINKIAESGVKALKIEGRLKKSGWVSTMTAIYREIIDNPSADLFAKIEELKKYTARETGSGHLFGHKNLIGQNENWSSYIKTTDIITVPELFYDKVNITINISQNISIDIKYREINSNIIESIPKHPKKAKLSDFDRICDKLSEDLIDYDYSVDINDNDLCCASSFINNLTSKIKAEIRNIEAKSDKYPTINDEIAEFIKQNQTKLSRTAKLGSIPDKIIIYDTQIREFITKNNIKIKTITVYITNKMFISDIYELAKKYSVIVAIPEIIYEDRLNDYRHYISELISGGIKNFEANSWTGIKLLEGLDITRYAGIGLGVLNHIAARFLSSFGFVSCYAAIESDIPLMKALSSFVDMRLEVVAFSRVPLFISRVHEDYFDNNKFTDKYVEITPNKVGDNMYFTPTKPFSIVNQNILSDNVLFDSISADLRFFTSPIDIFKDLSQGKISDCYLFNYDHKKNLV